MAQNLSNVWNKLYAEINNILLPDISNSTAPPAGFACMCFPGISVLKDDFDLTNTDNSTRVYALMNAIPKVNKIYIDSGLKVNGLFEQILMARFPSDNQAEVRKMAAEMEKAHAVLNAKDDKYGTKYDAYDFYSGKYRDAYTDYMSEKNRASDKIKIANAKAKMDSADNKWYTFGYKTEVNTALAIIKRYDAYTPTKVRNAAQAAFDLASEESYPVDFTPSTWATAPDGEGVSWSKIELTQNSTEVKIHNEIKKINSENNTNVLWSVYKNNVRDTTTEEKLNKSIKTDKLSFSFDVLKVVIGRKWFKSDLLTYPNTSIDYLEKGGLCPGSLNEANKGNYPCIPAAFAVARNMNIYSELSTEETTFLESVKKSTENYKIGFGIFSITKDYNSDTKLTDDEQKTFGKVTKISVDKGMQIIGFANTVQPQFPTVDSNKVKK